MKTKKIRAGFAIVNIIVGVILFLSSFTLFAQKVIEGGLLTFFLGLILLIVGCIALYIRKREDENEAKVRVANTVCFVISVLILATVIILSVLGLAGIL